MKYCPQHAGVREPAAGNQRSVLQPAPADLAKIVTQKRQHGQYYTEGNPFGHPAFRRWATLCRLPQACVLEPFAGANRLIEHLEGMGLCNHSISYDVRPASRRVRRRDTLAHFPEKHEACVTNPPWLARNSAAFRGLAFPDCRYDDLYKFALEKCLENCDWVAALVPESFIRAGLFQERLGAFVSLRSSLFRETGHPVGLALFQPDPVEDVEVWSGQQRAGRLSELEALRPAPLPDGPQVRFNVPDGNVGLIALDNTRTASIRFCEVAELADYPVKSTGRHITKLGVSGAVRIRTWNEYLRRFREQTRDVLMTSYKGMRKDGKYRRRLDWNLARGIVHHARP